MTDLRVLDNKLSLHHWLNNLNELNGNYGKIRFCYSVNYVCFSVGMRFEEYNQVHQTEKKD